MSLNISGGLSDWEFSKLLEPQDQMESVHVIKTATETKDINFLSNQLARFGKIFGTQRVINLKQPLVDGITGGLMKMLILTKKFLKKTLIWQDIGVNVRTLDAGWFGPNNKDTEWFDWRGDWKLVNKERFPSGIKHLSDYVHEKGMKFGFWCEIEGLGRLAKIRRKLPTLPAQRDGSDLGYACFGNPEAQEWHLTV